MPGERDPDLSSSDDELLRRADADAGVVRDPDDDHTGADVSCEDGGGDDFTYTPSALVSLMLLNMVPNAPRYNAAHGK